MVNELACRVFYNNWNRSLYSHFGICRMFRCFERIQWNAQAGFQYDSYFMKLRSYFLTQIPQAHKRKPF